MFIGCDRRSVLFFCRIHNSCRAVLAVLVFLLLVPLYWYSDCLQLQPLQRNGVIHFIQSNTFNVQPKFSAAQPNNDSWPANSSPDPLIPSMTVRPVRCRRLKDGDDPPLFVGSSPHCADEVDLLEMIEHCTGVKPVLLSTYIVNRSGAGMFGPLAIYVVLSIEVGWIHSRVRRRACVVKILEKVIRRHKSGLFASGGSEDILPPFHSILKLRVLAAM